MKIQENVPLKPFSNMKIGGPAKFFIEVFSSEELKEAVQWAIAHDERFYILGLGANTIFADEGFDGAVILQRNQNFEIRENKVQAESGVVFESLITETLKNNLTGIHRFSGIPSTVGGACFINLHYYTDLMGNLLESAEILDVENQETYQVDVGWFNYGYDKSKLQEKFQKNGTIFPKYVLLSATLNLEKVSDEQKWFAMGVADEIRRTRSFRYPAEPSVGSIFQNLPRDKKSFYGVDSTAAAYFIDRCGLKGFQIGGIKISTKHANIWVNPEEKGTSKDLLELISHVQKEVKKRFGIDLRPEARIVK